VARRPEGGGRRADSDREKAAFGAVAAREPPARRVKELICVAGRGAGKDRLPAWLRHVPPSTSIRAASFAVTTEAPQMAPSPAGQDRG
jgi:hypothetical protein